MIPKGHRICYIVSACALSVSIVFMHEDSSGMSPIIFPYFHGIIFDIPSKNIYYLCKRDLYKSIEHFLLRFGKSFVAQ
jgi:hypothetical protein